MPKKIQRLEKLVFSKKGWTLYKLAKEINVKDITVYRWNNAGVEPRTSNIRKISKAIGANISEVMACFESD